MKAKIAVLMTTFNRKDMTASCIESLVKGNPDVDFRFVITDDNSSDGTSDMLEALPYKIKVIKGDGNLFWNGGMRKSLGFALQASEKFDYAMLVNDDVKFYEGAIEKQIDYMNEKACKVLVGATCDDNGFVSYGGVKKLSNFFAKFDLMVPGMPDDKCDTFNCNCVIIEAAAFKEIGNLDGTYIHSMADYDYGMHIRDLGYDIILSSDYVGQCSDNDVLKTWRNPALPRKERLALKESPKGLPKDDWFYFVKKNYGLISACYHFITPYIRILIKK